MPQDNNEMQQDTSMIRSVFGSQARPTFGIFNMPTLDEIDHILEHIQVRPTTRTVFNAETARQWLNDNFVHETGLPSNTLAT